MAVDREKILQVAQKLVDKKRYDKAIGEYQKLVVDDPGDVRTLLKIGDLYLKVNKHEEAIATYEQVGEYYYREGFSVKAIAVYKQIRGIIKRHATHLEGRYGHIVPRLAEIYSQLGLTSDALAAYDEVASRLRQEGRERDALDIFKKVLELDPQNPIAHLRVADSYTRLGDIDKAIERFGEAAAIMVRLGRHDDSLKVLERLLQYRQEARYARTAAQLYLDRGGPNDGLAALAKLQLCYKADPKDLATLAILARAFDAIGQPTKAVEVLKESARVAKEKNDAEAFLKIVDVLMSRAPDDTFVQRLDEARRGPPSEEVQILADDELESIHPEDLHQPAPTSEAMEEILELDDADLQPADTDVHDLFGVGRADETSGARRLADEADYLHNQGQLQQAIVLLHDGLRNLGSSALLRQRLSDLLLESGDQEGSIRQKLTLAHEYLTAGAIDGAMGMLDEILLLQPDHPEATQLRSALGYGAQVAQRVTLHGDQGIDDLELDAPLQSYDVESGGVEQLLSRTSPTAPSSPDVLAGARIDEPFAGHPGAQTPYATPQAGAAPYDAGAARQLDEDSLDQADDLAMQGRFDEARVILAEQLRYLPNHPLILERLSEVDQMAAATVHADTSGAAYAPVPPEAEYGYPPAEEPSAGHAPVDVAQPYAAPEPVYAPQPQAADPGLAAPVQTHEPAPAAQPVAVAQPVPAAAEPVAEAPPPPAASQPQAKAGYPDVPGVGEVLEQFREGIRQQIDEGDAQTHYDLGVAYNEMGLSSDAISELTLAARDPKRECVCLSMIGQIRMGLGEIDAALDALHRALNAEQKTAEQQKAIVYEIANAYEMNNMPQQALHYFEWLATHHPDHDDPRGSVSQRVQALRSGSIAQRRPLPPVDEAGEEDVDSALDDMFGSGKPS